MKWDAFAAQVRKSGLHPRQCCMWHWQIRGGDRIVNCWPHTKVGFKYQAVGEKARAGDVKRAIEAAGEGRAWESPLEFAPHVPDTTPQQEPPWGSQERPVGLIRRIWRFLW